MTDVKIVSKRLGKIHHELERFREDYDLGVLNSNDIDEALHLIEDVIHSLSRQGEKE